MTNHKRPLVRVVVRRMTNGTDYTCTLRDDETSQLAAKAIRLVCRVYGHDPKWLRVVRIDPTPTR